MKMRWKSREYEGRKYSNMAKIKTKNAQKRYNLFIYALSFFISVVGMLLILKSRGFYPFKEKSLFVMDMQDQYLEFFASLRYLFTGENSLFYSGARSMGGNQLGLIAYYMGNPLSLITALFPLENIPLAIVVLTVLKIGLCGLSFSVYASYLWRQSERADVIQFMVIPFSVAYALMSYNMTYLLCLMWIDGVILLPWILLGVEKILDGRKGLQFLLALAALFFCCYYIGYMVGIFTAIYVVFRVLTRVTKDNYRDYAVKLLRFAVTTLLAVGVAAPVLIPVIKDLASGKLQDAGYVVEEIYNFQPFSLLFHQLRNGAYVSLTNSGLPAIYCGVIVLLCAVLFFGMKAIKIREKIGAVLILGVFCVSFYFTQVDYIWHGFQYPNWFPYRYAFLCSAFLLYMALRMVICIPWEKISWTNQRKPIYEGIVLVVMLIVALDMGLNGREILRGVDNQFLYSNVDEYTGFLKVTKPLTDYVKQSDTGYYRIRQDYEYSKNDAMLLGFNGMNHYSSTHNTDIQRVTAALGMANMSFWNTGYGSTPLTDSLFDVKYILENDDTFPDYKKVFETEYGTAVYRNDMALGIAYGAVVNDMEPDLTSKDPFENQNALLNSIADTNEAYFSEYECVAKQEENGWSYSFTAASENPVYFYLDTDEYSFDERDVCVNGRKVGSYFTADTKCCLYLGEFKSGQEVTVTIPEQMKEARAVMVAQLHMERLQPVIQKLKAGEMQVEKWHGGNITGKILLDEGNVILTSIPYDEGWRVEIDGHKAETQVYAGAFLAVPAQPGEHQISLSYISPGFFMGMILCAIAVLAAVVYFFDYGKRIRNSKS